jgi:hypothetical protein
VAAALHFDRPDERVTGRADAGRQWWRRRCLPSGGKSTAPAVLALTACGGGGAPFRLAG